MRTTGSIRKKLILKAEVLCKSARRIGDQKMQQEMHVSLEGLE